MVSPIRLGSVSTPGGKANEAVYVQPSKTIPSLPFGVLVFFGGDVQDYHEVMATHRDHKHYVDWSLTRTASILASKFPAHHVLVIKPSRMERKTFSCYDNFVDSNNVGAPTHNPGVRALSHLAKLIPEALRKAQVLQTSTGENEILDQACEENIWVDSSLSSCSSSPYKRNSSAVQHCGADFLETSNHWSKEEFQEITLDEIILIGFSKGCVVLNQIITELHALLTVEILQNKMLLGFIDTVRSMYWLDGGHAGGSNTWITTPSILKSLATLQHISVHIHVTPYQVCDYFRPWIGKECKSFYDILRRAGAKVTYFLHFEEDSPSLLLHFKVLDHFV